MKKHALVAVLLTIMLLQPFYIENVSGYSNNDDLNLKKATEITVVIPDTFAGIEDVLTELCKKQALELDITVINEGVKYSEKLLEQLNSDKNIDIFWLRDETDATYIKSKGVSIAGTMDNKRQAPYKAYARMSANQLKHLNIDGNSGIVVGTKAEGTLVDIKMLSEILGTPNTNIVMDDLTNCTYEQWVNLIESISEYIKKPDKIKIRLHNHDYTTPKYRPDSAKLLRSIYSVPTANKASIIYPQVSSLMSSYDLAITKNNAKSEEDIAKKYINAAIDAIEIKTKFMSSMEGAKSRGESFNESSAINIAGAETLFSEGKALFLEGDTNQALRLKEKYPQLEGSLALIPTKIPLPEKDAAEDVNNTIAVTTGGILCLNADSDALTESESIILNLLATEKGQYSIKNELKLYPVGRLNTSPGLESQINQYISSGKIHLLPQNYGLKQSSSSIGKWFDKELMAKDEWGEDEYLSAYTAMQSSLGLLQDDAKEE